MQLLELDLLISPKSEWGLTFCSETWLGSHRYDLELNKTPLGQHFFAYLVVQHKLICILFIPIYDCSSRQWSTEFLSLSYPSQVTHKGILKSAPCAYQFKWQNRVGVAVAIITNFLPCPLAQIIPGQKFHAKCSVKFIWRLQKFPIIKLDPNVPLRLPNFEWNNWPLHLCATTSRIPMTKKWDWKPWSLRHMQQQLRFRFEIC